MAACWLAAHPASAEEKDTRLAKGVQDNSFLIEEAYNQEPGVVQHIATFRRQNRDRLFSFTQEWPVVSQAHQFSYTVPYSWLRADGETNGGPGDVPAELPLSRPSRKAPRRPRSRPRLSLVLPTGDFDRELGNNSYGVQVNLPVSKIVADRVTVHGNAGATTSSTRRSGSRPDSMSAAASSSPSATIST